ncbi:MAG: tetratricopeptide repeat protein [Candidatus Zixiibacteriota bacterium]
MKTTLRYIVVTTIVLGLVFAGSVAAKQRKLPAGAYIKTAKIHILSGEQERYEQAILMLDSLFLNYGPHAEGLFWMSQIYVDYIDKTPDLANRKKYVELMVAYNDSLKMCCANKDIDKKNKDGCKEYIEKVDSTSVLFWRQYYNDGIEQLNAVKVAVSDIANETDSANIAYFQEQKKKFYDSCYQSMELAIILDSTNFKPYVVISTLLEQDKNYKESSQWLEKAIKFTTNPEDRKPLLIQTAYNYVNQGSYCDAIPYFQDYLKIAPEDFDNARNLTICYNNCQMYDSAFALNHRLLEKSPGDPNIISGIGLYWEQQARFASDSATAHREAGDEAGAAQWRDKRQELFDSSRVYFKQVFELKPDDVMAVQQYALVTAILGNFEEAIVPFTRLTELEPGNVDHWISLGDCNLNLTRFQESANAYEKVIELEPNNLAILERLSDLYKELKQATKLQDIEAKIKALES